MKKITIIIASLLFLVAAVRWMDSEHTVHLTTSEIDRFSYIAKYSGNANNTDYLPMLVALHGNGDTANNFYETALNQIQKPARIILLKGPIPYHRGDAWPIDADALSVYGEAVNEAIGILVDKYPTTGKPVLLGFSGGGVMAYYQSVIYGNNYSAIIPVSGKLTEAMLEGGDANSGAIVHAYHGRNDRVISFSSGSHAVEILKNRDINIKFTAFDGGHLGLFTNAKSDITMTIEEALIQQ